MSENGFFRYAGKLESLPCLVEDFVYDNINLESGNQMVSAGLNNLFGEVTWFYPTTGSSVVNRQVTYNYFDSSPQRPVWTVGSLARTMWEDAAVCGNPHALSYEAGTDTSFDVVGNKEGRTIYYQHETGTDQVNPDGSTTALESFIQSFSFSLQPNQSEVFLAMRRFLPNFKVLTGNNQITISVKDFPSDDDEQTALSPFTIDSTTTKIDTRARGRYANIKIQNTAAGESWRFGTFQADLQPDGRR